MKMTFANGARCREKRSKCERAVNRRIELHGKSFTISPAVSRPVLKVKDAKTKLEVGQVVGHEALSAHVSQVGIFLRTWA